ncbi:hypothetical protein Tco_0989756 [Tanacetum coccineum]|uniref:Uncharacterized protein n=1 Tax=Tanacetum coccineum TaxID=301880 RepID=A0ABQ5EW43_9ASTR
MDNFLFLNAVVNLVDKEELFNDQQVVEYESANSTVYLQEELFAKVFLRIYKSLMNKNKARILTKFRKIKKERSIAEMLAEIYELKDKFNGLSIEIRKIIQEAKELRESEARARSKKIFIDDDDDNLGFYAVHPFIKGNLVIFLITLLKVLYFYDIFYSINDLGYKRFRGEEIDKEYERDCEIRIQKLKQDFNIWGSEVRKKEKAYEDEKYAAACRYMLSVTCDDDDTDDDDDYDDDFYDCVDIEEDGGEIDLDISKIVDISLREKLVKSYLLIEKINTFSLSPPIPVSPIFCPSSTIPVVDLDLPLEEADVPSFFDDSMILSEYESFTFDDEPVMAEVNVFDEINTSELSYPGIGENVVSDEEEDTFTFTTRSFLPFVTYPEVLPVSYSTGSEDKVFNPGIFDNDAFKDKSSKELAPSKALLTLDVFDPLHPPLMDFNVFRILEASWFKIVEGQSNS